jgi:hypothetical protein
VPGVPAVPAVPAVHGCAWLCLVCLLCLMCLLCLRCLLCMLCLLCLLILLRLPVPTMPREDHNAEQVLKAHNQAHVIRENIIRKQSKMQKGHHQIGNAKTRTYVRA